MGISPLTAPLTEMQMDPLRMGDGHLVGVIRVAVILQQTELTVRPGGVQGDLEFDRETEGLR